MIHWFAAGDLVGSINLANISKPVLKAINHLYPHTEKGVHVCVCWGRGGGGKLHTLVTAFNAIRLYSIDSVTLYCSSRVPEKVIESILPFGLSLRSPC